MQTSEAGLAFIAREEGEVDHVYKDSVGVATIGIGHALRSGETFPNGITHQQAMALLKQDVGIAENAINGHTKVPLTQNQFDSLVSFTFNLGGGAYESSTLLKLLNQGDYAGAAAQFPVWDKAGGVVDQEILGRRLREQKVFLTPDPVVTLPSSPAVALPPPSPVIEAPIIAPSTPAAAPPAPPPATSPLMVVINVVVRLIRLLVLGGH